MYTLNCKGKLLTIGKPLLMGIVNATPDSFYEGHLGKGVDGMLALVEKMISEGADIIDIGGQSSRPGSERVSVTDEEKRVLPLIMAVQQRFPGTIISVDTYYSKVAAAAVAAGASIVNDISAGNMDEAMIETVASLHVPYIAMHMQGTPATMQKEPVYNNVVTEVLDYFIAKVDECKKAGIRDLIIDPGFGFGKTIQHNFQLLKGLPTFSILERPVLAGLSRKRTIYKTLNIEPEDALNGTTVVNTMALMNGASILRVHDVKEAKEAISLYNEYVLS